MTTFKDIAIGERFEIWVSFGGDLTWWYAEKTSEVQAVCKNMISSTGSREMLILPDAEAERCAE